MVGRYFFEAQGKYTQRGRTGTALPAGCTTREDFTLWIKKQLRNTAADLRRLYLGHGLCGAKCRQRLHRRIHLFGQPQLAGLRLSAGDAACAPRRAEKARQRPALLDPRQNAGAGRYLLRHGAVCGIGGPADGHRHDQHGQGRLYDGAVCGAGAGSGVFWAAAPASSCGAAWRQRGGAVSAAWRGAIPWPDRRRVAVAALRLFCSRRRFCW